ncbi:alpha/beta hydrolase [Brevundimonas sp.]|uniref:alpha/beta hydrolase n=1 Tax=Brevundimonas sp. TaxID=1871086 RepID=UPI002ED88FEA
MARVGTEAGKTVVLIHGLWVTTDSWANFRKPWEAAGWTVLTPTWAMLKGRSKASLNASPPDGLGGLTVGRIVDGLQAAIEALPEPPLLVGHSFGGLFTQMLLDRGVGRAGIAINPAPIAGFLPGWWTLTAALPPILRWNGWNRPYAMTRRRWAERFANAAPAALQDSSYDAYVIPTPGRVFYQAAFQVGTRIDPRRRRQSLLITAGERDRLVTPYLSRAAFRLQSRSPARTDFHAFPGRSHLLLAEPGWEEVADVCIRWAEAHS